MAKTIWKYVVETWRCEKDGSFGFRGPIISILSARKQRDQTSGAFSVWALVDTEAEPKDHRVIVQGTGNPFPLADEGLTFIGTVVDGHFAWHVFDGGPVA